MEVQALHETLVQLATNYRWSWKTSCGDLLMSVPGADSAIHPLQTIRALDTEQLIHLGADDAFLDSVIREADDLRRATDVAPPSIAYCSPEFGFSQFAHQYAGGLGILAGDHLKASSDAGLPIVGVGLFYHLGAFRQMVENLEQVETYSPVEPGDIAARDTGVRVAIPFPDRDVAAVVYRVDVGSVPLLLLDTDVPENTEVDRQITDRLYIGSEEHRVDQEMVLGVGGARALEAMGWDIEVYHLNEGHAGFLALELVDRCIGDRNLTSAVSEVKDCLVFTTHTPVPAGIDKLSRQTLGPFLELWAQRWGVGAESVWDLGSDPRNGDEFNMAMFCLRLSRTANGVSELHGEVSRELFSQLAEGRAITHVTNGVHARTWMSRSIQDLFDDRLGHGWDHDEEGSWSRVDAIDDGALHDARNDGSVRLAKLMTDHGISLDPDALIVGFARRFAPYKRSTLILRQRERLMEILESDRQPVHFLFAGKAHPLNSPGRELLSEIVAFSESAEAKGRFSFIPDYDMNIGAALVQGCDVWLNNPIRPQEASGTSGEKVALNGGLNLSVLDGWWAEMFDGENGWAIASSNSDVPDQRDAEDSEALIDSLLLVRTEYFEDRMRFDDRIRHAWRTLGPRVSAARMVRDYEERLYRR